MSKPLKSYRQMFIDIAQSKGYKIQSPTSAQKKSNIDIILDGQVNGSQTLVSIDIKKKNGKNANQWVYIEYQSSQGGKGWIYGGSDFIVFETSKEFIFVHRKKLLDWLSKSSSVRWDLPYVDKPWLSKYRLFRRTGTQETISQIKVSDLFLIEGYKIWQKL